MKACLLSSILLIFLTVLPLHAKEAAPIDLQTEEEISFPGQRVEEGANVVMNSGNYLNEFGRALGTVTRRSVKDYTKNVLKYSGRQAGDLLKRTTTLRSVIKPLGPALEKLGNVAGQINTGKNVVTIGFYVSQKDVKGATKAASDIAASTGAAWAGAETGATIGAAVGGPPGAAVGGVGGAITGSLVYGLGLKPKMDEYIESSEFLDDAQDVGFVEALNRFEDRRTRLSPEEQEKYDRLTRTYNRDRLKEKLRDQLDRMKNEYHMSDSAIEQYLDSRLAALNQLPSEISKTSKPESNKTRDTGPAKPAEIKPPKPEPPAAETATAIPPVNDRKPDNKDNSEGVTPPGTEENTAVSIKDSDSEPPPEDEETEEPNDWWQRGGTEPGDQKTNWWPTTGEEKEGEDESDGEDFSWGDGATSGGDQLVKKDSPKPPVTPGRKNPNPRDLDLKDARLAIHSPSPYVDNSTRNKQVVLRAVLALPDGDLVDVSDKCQWQPGPGNVISANDKRFKVGDIIKVTAVYKDLTAVTYIKVRNAFLEAFKDASKKTRNLENRKNQMENQIQRENR